MNESSEIVTFGPSTSIVEEQDTERHNIVDKENSLKDKHGQRDDLLELFKGQLNEFNHSLIRGFDVMTNQMQNFIGIMSLRTDDSQDMPRRQVAEQINRVETSHNVENKGERNIVHRTPYQIRDVNSNNWRDSMLEKKMKPQKYDGKEDLEEYLTQFELISELNNWGYKSNSLYLAGNRKTGDARGIINELNEHDRRDFDAIVNALKTRFGSIHEAEVFRSELQTRVKGRTENAIPFKDIRIRLREVSPKTVAEAENIAVRLDAVHMADRSRNCNIKARGVDTETNDLSTKIDEVIKKIDKVSNEVETLKSKDTRSQEFKGNNRNYDLEPLQFLVNEFLMIGVPREVLEGVDQLPELLKNLYDESSEELSNEQQEMLQKLLLKHNNLFFKTSQDIGNISIVEHTIDTGDAKPIKLRPYRIPLSKKLDAEEEIRKMADIGIIEPSSSAWCAPIVMVTKKNGSIRFCCDFRKINHLTIKNYQPLPRIDDSLAALNDCRWLRHNVSEKGIATDEEKIKAVKDWTIPKNVKQERKDVDIIFSSEMENKEGKEILQVVSLEKPIYQEHDDPFIKNGLATHTYPVKNVVRS
ncbi:unnamed protein product [Mytilus coruscus]|uniref:Peptidase A9 domain-containing protein n=1 Tax=Mytilus coruscus TaxID=42192 RepID=A0A6J8CJD3_MYTCO|nr:unnamed protein product [Mytilus coruscus]